MLISRPNSNVSLVSFFFFLTLGLFIYYLFMAVLGLHFCARAFSSCGKWGPLFITVRGPLIIAASLVAEHRLQMRRPSNCGSRAQLLRGMWDLPRPGLEPVSPALAGCSTTAPPGKPSLFSLIVQSLLSNRLLSEKIRVISSEFLHVDKHLSVLLILDGQLCSLSLILIWFL